MFFIDIIYHAISPQRFSLDDIISAARNVLSGKVLIEAREKENIYINRLADIIGSDKDLTVELQQYMKNSPYAASIRGALYTHRYAIYAMYRFKSNIFDQIHSLVEEVYIQTKMADEMASLAENTEKQRRINPKLRG